MLDGRIAEMGTYADLMSSGGALSKLVEEHTAEEHDQKDDEHIVVREEQELKQEKIEVEAESTPEKPAVALIADEERETGAVSWSTYRRYIAACGGVWKTPLFLAAMLLAQASKVGTSILLGYWSEDSIPGWDQGRCEFFEEGVFASSSC
jgi:ATP-binding cassette subfamily C (CFTR/MRP) protein 1